MAKVVNLRQARKQKARAAKDAKAAENRAKFGQSKLEKAKRELEAHRQSRSLDGARTSDD